jgi:dTDP-4-dehydrorhamnose reductase
MKLLILGGTGLLGTALANNGLQRGWDVIRSGSRSGDVICDIRKLDQLETLLYDINPNVLINAAAIVELSACENDPDLAYSVNTHPVKHMAAWSQANNRKFLQISTDHFFLGDGPAAHPESAKVALVNEYARSKFAAEALAANDPKSLILRTTFVGISPDIKKPSFYDWVMNSLADQTAMTLFSDAYFSPIEVRDLAEAIFDLIHKDICGVLNVAGREVVSKDQFIRAIAQHTGHSLEGSNVGSVASLSPTRGDSLGLDVTKAQSILGRRLPDLKQTINKLFSGEKCTRSPQFFSNTTGKNP